VKSPVCFLEHHHVGAHSRTCCSCAILAGALLTGLLLLFDLNRILQQENLCLVRIVNIYSRVDRGHLHGIQDCLHLLAKLLTHTHRFLDDYLPYLLITQELLTCLALYEALDLFIAQTIAIIRTEFFEPLTGISLKTLTREIEVAAFTGLDA